MVNSRGSTPPTPAVDLDQNGMDGGGGGGVRVTAPPVIEKKKGLLGKKQETLSPYDVVPSIRPLVIVGPSLKGYEVTDMMQKAVFEYLKNRFTGKIYLNNLAAMLCCNNNIILHNDLVLVGPSSSPQMLALDGQWQHLNCQINV